MTEFGRRGGWWVVAQIAVFAVYAWSLRSRGDLPSPLDVVGWVLAGAGAALAVGGMVSLGPNLTPYPEPVPEGELVERGVYRLVRHPIYGGISMGAIGLALARGSLAALAVGVLLLAFFAVKAQREERRLVAAHPSYEDYRRRVRARLVPWLL